MYCTRPKSNRNYPWGRKIPIPSYIQGLRVFPIYTIHPIKEAWRFCLKFKYSNSSNSIHSFDRFFIYLINSNFATSIQKVIHISPATGHGELWNGWWGNVDASDWSRSHVIGQMTKHNSIRQGGAKSGYVIRQSHFQLCLQDLEF